MLKFSVIKLKLLERRFNKKMRLSGIKFNNHPILKNLELNFKDSSGNIYGNIILVGENGCGKTTILNEIFNYDKSNFIIEKEQNYNLCGPCLHKNLLISQDIKYRKAINKICKNIDGREIYPDITEIDNTNGLIAANITTLLKDNVINSSELLSKELLNLKDENIVNYFNGNNKDLMENIPKMVGIKNVGGSINPDVFSSGEQELILRLETLRKRVQLNLDNILIDEPETSLHPKWQLMILKFIVDILKDRKSNERDLQLFVATHSENILKSALSLKDTLIIRLYKEDNVTKAQNITSMGRVLKYVSYPEIQFLVFDVPTIDYHNQLYSELLELCKNKNCVKQIYVEEKIIKYGKDNNIEVFNEFNYSRDKNSGNRETLPTYIRNASSHIENKDRNINDINDETLKKSIEIMRNILKN